MRTHPKLVSGVLATLVVAVALSLALTRRHSVILANVTYRGYLSGGNTNLTFWVTNPTPKMVSIDFQALETLDGTIWRGCPLWTAKPYPVLVHPYTATQQRLTVTNPLDSSSWRLKVTEAQELTGPARYYAPLRWYYKAKIPLTTNSLASNMMWWGHHRKVIFNETGEVSE
jgi:hypothetical protein